MKYKPNELYGRAVEFGALAAADLPLERFLSTLAIRFRLHSDAGIPAVKFIADLAVSANIPSRFLTGGLPERGDSEPNAGSNAKAETIELLERQLEDMADLRAG